MSVIVTDTGFARDDWTGGFAAPDEAAAGSNAAGLDLPGDADPAALADRLGGLGMVRVSFPSFADGRGFTLARRLRRMGFTGRLRAAGHVLADQYAMARRVGFDEVEISDDQARRQPEADWLARADWRTHDYQTRLRAG
ncbi:oxidoreductase [Rhodobacteraceae bacterium WD3A24]|nr:oxidoreductase [Rhodobacteraceae bacterium WD3A24]